MRRPTLRLLPLALALSGVLFVGACDENGTVSEVALEKYTQLRAGTNALSLLVGDAANLVAQLVKETGANVDPAQVGLQITWSSSASGVASVDAAGRVVAVGPGVALISARYQDLSAQVTVTVAGRPSQISLATTSLRGSAGAAIPGGVSLQVLDKDGKPVAGTPVRFTVLSGAGSVSPGLATTSGDGRAATQWTLGRSAGRHSMEIAVLRGGSPSTAPAADPSRVGEPDEVLTSTTVFADVDPAPPASVSISPTSATMRAGDLRPFLATIVDGFGNPTANQQVSFSSSDPTVVAVDATGTAFARRPGSASVIATAVQYPALQSVATVTVTAGAPASIAVVSGNGQTGPAGRPLPQPLTVEVRDGGGNPLSGVPVAWSTTAGALSAMNTSTDAAGRTSVVLTLAGAGGHTVRAVTGQLAPAVFSATATNALDITTTSLPDGSAGTPYSQAVSATGGSGSYSWSVGGGALPAGLSLAPSTGVISGTPTSPGTSSFTIRVNSGSASHDQPLSITIAGPATPPDITTLSLPGGLVGAAYGQTLSVSGGNGTYAWSVSAGALPGGLTLNSGTGTISGTPTGVGSFNFTVQVLSGGQTDAQALSIAVVSGPVIITTGSVPAGTQGVAYSQTLAATGGDGVSYAWSLIAGVLPAGVTLSGAGALSGTPSAFGSFNFNVQVASGGQTAIQPYALMIAASGSPTTIASTSPLPSGTRTQAYSQALSATGGNGSYSWLQTGGTLPTGLTFSAAGVLSGTATAAGTFTFTVQVTSASQTDSKAFQVTIDNPAVTITTATPLPGGTRQTAYSRTLAATGGDGSSYAWSVSAGALPIGITLSGGGVLSGTPTVAGAFNFTAQAVSGGQTGTQAFALTIANPPVTITTATPLPTATQGVAYTQTLAATGGDGASYTWSVASGALPTGITLSAVGLLSGTSSATGTYNFTAQAVSAGVTGTKAMQLFVDIPPTPEPTYTGAAGETLVHDENFDDARYADLTTAGAVNNGSSAPRVAPVHSPVGTSQPVDPADHGVVTGRGGTGNALRLIYDGISGGGPEWFSLNDPSTPDGVSHYFTYWARITYPGGTSAFLSSAGHAIAIKWFMAWHTSPNQGERAQWNTHKGFPCPIGPGGSNPLNNADTYWQFYDGSTTTDCQAFQPVGPYLENMVDGSWHRYTMQYKPNSAPGARDGISRMWIDGVKVIDISLAACSVTPIGGEKPWCGLDDLDAIYSGTGSGVGNVIWGGPDTEGNIDPWTYDFDDFRWWSTP